MGGVKRQRRNVISLLYLDRVPRNSAPGGLAYIWKSKWVGIITVKTERMQIHFLSDVLIAVASLDLKVSIVITLQRSMPKMLKMALFDCGINEKCCSVDGGRGICPLFSSPPRGIWQLKSTHPREFAIQGKKNANARGSARGGRDWAQVELTGA